MELTKSKKFNGVYHYVMKNGDVSYYIMYRDSNGKQYKQKIGIKSGGITENYCNQIRNDAVSKLKLGELPPSTILRRKHKTITLNSVADHYFEHHNTKSKNKQLSKYNLHIRDVIGSKDVDLIEIKDMNNLQNSLIDKKLSPSTVNCYIDIVSAACNYGLSKSLYKGKNPTKFIKKLRVDNKRERFLSTAEIGDLLESVESNPTLYLFTKLALSTGARLQTILNIKKRDVNLANRIITLKDFKNESTYNGYITDNDLMEALKLRMSLIENSDYLVWEDGIKRIDKYVSRKMSDIFYDLFNYDLDETDKDYRKQKVVIHTLRHTMLSHLALNGASPFKIKQLSNHKSLAMVERYVKLNPQSGKDNVEALYKH